MGTRLKLQSLLETFVPNVYFQPPATIKMKYPCIVYQRSRIDSRFADDSSYNLFDRYTLTLIEYDPDSPISHLIMSLPKCSFERHYTADNLHHNVFNLYY